MIRVGSPNTTHGHYRSISSQQAGCEFDKKKSSPGYVCIARFSWWAKLSNKTPETKIKVGYGIPKGSTCTIRTRGAKKTPNVCCIASGHYCSMIIVKENDSSLSRWFLTLMMGRDKVLTWLESPKASGLVVNWTTRWSLHCCQMKCSNVLVGWGTWLGPERDGLLVNRIK